MKPVDREGNGLRKEEGVGKHGPQQQPPIMEPLFSDYTQNNDRSYECCNIVGPKSTGHLLYFLGYIFAQECPDPFIVVFG